ncbi:MAG: hypothetical protein ACM3QU_06935 [Verrucomicrobiota bacterium]
MSHRALWLLPLAAAAVVVVLVVGLALGWDRGSAGSPPAVRPFAATASLSSRAVSFGDPLVARIDLVVDPRAVDPRSIDIRTSFGAYRVAGRSLRTTTDTVERLSYRYVLECLASVCAPVSSRVEQRFQPATVSYRVGTGAPVTVRVAWPSYLLSSRLTDAERRSPGRTLRFDATPPAASYRIDPGTLRGLLAALAGLLALAAAVLVVLALRPRSAVDAAEPSESRLAQALRAVRASTANGRPAERRKALGWLGRELRAAKRPSEADEARRLAWSAAAPTATSAGEFATQVETAEKAE